jgi:hypothetical protein
MKVENANITACLTAKVNVLQEENANMTLKVTVLQNAMKEEAAIFTANVTAMQVDIDHAMEDTHTLCMNEGYIHASQTCLRFLGRQDLNPKQTSKYMLDAYNNNSHDQYSGKKVVDMLITGLGVKDWSQHGTVVNLLDKILNRRNGIAHPRSQQERLIDTVIDNFQRYKARGGQPGPEDELVILILRRSDHVAVVPRLDLLKNVV